MIQVAADLFHQQGVGATSPNQIIEMSRTGKGQFYYYFESKEGIVHEVLHRYLSAINSNESPVKYEIVSWQDLGRWFASQIELQKRFGMTRGCPLGTIGNELTENDVLVQRDLDLIVEVIHNKLATFFIREKARGLLAKNADAECMADFCIAAIQGAMLLGKVKRNPHVAEAVAREALAHLEGKIVAPRRSDLGTSNESH